MKSRSCRLLAASAVTTIRGTLTQSRSSEVKRCSARNQPALPACIFSRTGCDLAWSTRRSSNSGGELAGVRSGDQGVGRP